MRKLVLLSALTFSVCLVSAQPLFDYSDIAGGKFTQKSVSGLRSMSDGEHYSVADKQTILKYSYATGELVDTLCNVMWFADSLRSIAGDGSVAVEIDGYDLSTDESKILFRYGSRPVYRRSNLSYYAVYDTTTGIVTPLGNDIRYAALSPDGSRTAFVKDNDIYYKNLSDGFVGRITWDGKLNHIINGIPDWVYEEEFALYHAMRWSVDGTSLAYLRFDETMVRDYTIEYTTREPGASQSGNPMLYPVPYTFKYPKAGESNSLVTLHVYDVSTGNVSDVTQSHADIYIPHFDWTPAGGLYYFRLNRLQNHLEVFLTDKASRRKLIYEERSPYYIDDVGPSTITFLPDSKRFVARNETRTGYMHLYMYDIDKGFRYALTSGEWEVKNIAAVSDKKIWFISNEISPLRTNLYSVDIKGKNKKRLTPLDGTYRVAPSLGFKYYISYFSNIFTPNTVTLHRGDGALVRILEDNTKLKEYIADLRLPRKEFFFFTDTTGGKAVRFNCYMIRPGDFDPGRKYPVLLTQYSGPGSQQVADKWSVGWEDALVQQGYIVACIDPRGTGGMGEAFKKVTYGCLGRYETEDQIKFARNLASRPFVDAERIGIYGWSYGGFMSLNCILKGADVFKMAISIAPVTSWRFYDSIYTERYNGLPQDNAEGYDDPSPINHASKLKGKLLLVHGSADDNVHAQNTYMMAREFIKAGKSFDMMIYPDDNHSMVPSGRHHVRHKMVEYCLENL